MKPYRSYHRSLIRDLKDPREAAAYLNAAFEEGDRRAFLFALRHVVEAQLEWYRVPKGHLPFYEKISLQKISRKGADAHEVLMSLLQTLRLQDKNPISFLKTAYLHHRQGNPVPLLSLVPSR